MASSPLFRLVYFPTHGRALPIRLAAVLNGLEWEDCLLKRDAYTKMKGTGDITARWNALPQVTFYNQPIYIKTDVVGVTVGQSTALLRHIGQLREGVDTHENTYNLYPKHHPFECLLVNEVMDSMEDAVKLIIPSFMEQDEQKKYEMRKDLTDNPEKLPLFFNRYDKIINENDTIRGHKHGYFVGDCLTVADLKIFSLTSLFHPYYKDLQTMQLDGIRDDFLKEYPRLNNHAEMLAQHQTIKSFMESFNEISNEFMQDEDKQEMVIKYPKQEYPGMQKTL